MRRWLEVVVLIGVVSAFIMGIAGVEAEQPPTPPQRVFGDVTYADGTPAVDVTITFRLDNGDVFETDVTDSNGFYDTDVKPGLESNIPDPSPKENLYIWVEGWDSGEKFKWESLKSERIDITGVPVPNKPPIADFSFSPTSPTDADSIQFTDKSSDDGYIVSWSWDFGDGSTSSQENPIHKYSEEGDYKVILEVTDNGSPAKTDSTSQIVSVSNAPPVADFSFSPSSPVTDETVSFDAGASYDPSPKGMIENYEWDWEADGTIDATGITASHSFATVGNHPVWLRGTDDDGATDTVSKTVTVTAPPAAPAPNKPPIARFTFSPSEPMVDQTVSFDATGSSDPDGTIVSFNWDLDGDGQYDDATGSTTSRSFATAGDHEVGVKVTDNGGAVDVARKTVTVSAPPAPAEFEVSNLRISPKEPEPGETVTIKVDVKNIGGTRGTYTARLKIEGEVVKTKDVTLDPGEERTITFTWVPEREGIFSLGIGPLTGTLTSKKPPKPPKPFPWGIAIAVIVIIAVIIGATWYLGRRRKGSKPQ